jgi:formylglycine-generating enzyme required for sulfatase activity
LQFFLLPLPFFFDLNYVMYYGCNSLNINTLRMKNLIAIIILCLLSTAVFAQTPSKKRAAASKRVAGEPEMVFVKGGTFIMGCTNEQSNNCTKKELPPHSVTVNSFSIGKYEVTQAQWEAVMGNNPSHFKGDSLPVEQVNWDDIQGFIRKLNTRTSNVYRLPTEAEWAYAARGGNVSQGYTYSGSNNIDDVAWYWGNSGGTPHAVGTKSPNELGIYDMTGNIVEWCNDWYGDYSSLPQTNPKGAKSGVGRVVRGGGWGNNARYIDVSYRYYGAPGDRSYGLGFRLVCTSSE